MGCPGLLACFACSRSFNNWSVFFVNPLAGKNLKSTWQIRASSSAPIPTRSACRLAERGFTLFSENVSANLYRTVMKQSFAIHFLPSVLRKNSVGDGVGPRSLSSIFA